MSDRRLSSFIDALVSGRRPEAFKADPEDVEVLRTAIELRAARPGDAIPDEQFVSDLYQSLAEQADASPAANVHPLRMRRARTALVAAAASVALVGGTFAATESFNQSPAYHGSRRGAPRRCLAYRNIRNAKRRSTGADRRL